jgi:hypothetical protein
VRHDSEERVLVDSRAAAPRGGSRLALRGDVIGASSEISGQLLREPLTHT